MFRILSWIIRYIFIILIYYFLYGIIRLIYLDIQHINKINQKGSNNPYLKLINRKERLDFDIQEFYDLENETTIGRSRDNIIQILDKYISSKHLKIIMDEGEYFLEDQGSVNGTYLNSTRIEDVAKLKNGDRIGLGQIEFLFVKEAVEE
ncbi:MAG: FHA domain-containing protein [Natronincolaceae bacterium]|nr:FHA domain-containing protein [Bacillota bacterium]NLK90726.1 FHA domain-containing protein [Clostridiales bacterium]